MSDDKTIEDLEYNVKSSRNVDKRQKWILFWLVGITMLLALGLLNLYMETRGEAAASAEVAVSEQQEKVEVASEARQALCGDKDQEIYDRELCEKWAGIADESPIEPVGEPPVVIGGPSQADLVQAFAVYCQQGNCKGQDGADPTPDEVAAAFARFCSDGRCTGPAGGNGADGTSGVDGDAGANGANGADAPPPTLDLMLTAVTSYCSDGRCVGPQGEGGPPPTDDAVAAAVASYCASGSCVGPSGPAGVDGAPGADSTVPGPQGETGTQGEPGTQGVSIVDVDCVGEGADSSWQITLSDGQVLNGGGPCQASTLPIEPPMIGGPS
jgi:hypothetical protein